MIFYPRHYSIKVGASSIITFGSPITVKVRITFLLHFLHWAWITKVSLIHTILGNIRFLQMPHSFVIFFRFAILASVCIMPFVRCQSADVAETTPLQKALRHG